MPDQTITGSTPIPSGETFPTAEAAIIQILITGTTTIPSGEYFAPKSGVYIDPRTVPRALYFNY